MRLRGHPLVGLQLDPGGVGHEEVSVQWLREGDRMHWIHPMPGTFLDDTVRCQCPSNEVGHLRSRQPFPSVSSRTLRHPSCIFGTVSMMKTQGMRHRTVLCRMSHQASFRTLRRIPCPHPCSGTRRTTSPSCPRVGGVWDHRMMVLRTMDRNQWKVSHFMIATGLPFQIFLNTILSVFSPMII